MGNIPHCLIAPVRLPRDLFNYPCEASLIGSTWIEGARIHIRLGGVQVDRGSEDAHETWWVHPRLEVQETHACDKNNLIDF